MSVPYFKFLSFLFSVDNIEGVSTVKHLHKLTSLIAMLFTVSMYTHLLMGWRRCKQCYYSNHDSSEATKQYGEMEVVDTAQHCRGRVHDTTSGRREGKLQHHPTHTHHQTHHQAPECTLNTHKHTQKHIQVTKHAFQHWYAATFYCKGMTLTLAAVLGHTWVCSACSIHFPTMIICHCHVTCQAHTRATFCHLLCLTFSKECDLCGST